MNRLYICRDGRTVEGPFTPDEITAMAAAGAIGPDAQVCPEGEQVWRPIADLARMDPRLSPSLPYSFERALSTGWRTVGRFYGSLLGASSMLLAAALPMVVISYVIGPSGPSASSGGQSDLERLLLSQAFSAVYSFFITTPIAAGAQFMMVRALRHEPFSFALLFAGYRRLGSLVLVALCLWAVALPALAPAIALQFIAPQPGAPPASASAAPIALLLPLACGALIWCIALMWLTVRLSPALVLALDDRFGALTAGEALRRSWLGTRRAAWSLVGLFLVLGLIAGATLLCCLLPMLFVGYPVMLATQAAAYTMLFPPPAPSEGTPA